MVEGPRYFDRAKVAMTPVGFEPTISAGERPQTHTLDLAATGTGFVLKKKIF
jgi:hypothetical protein